MKKTASFLLLLAGLAWFAACKKDTATDFQQWDDDALAAAIAGDRDKEATDPGGLPASVMVSLATEDFDTYMESAALATGKGYEIILANDEQVYFNLSGERLRNRPLRAMGRCGALGGESIPVDQLRPAIVDYITANYPDAQILRAKRRGDSVVVLLSGQIIVVFSPDGIFEAADQHWHDCRPCQPADQINLPATIITQIETLFPGAEIKRICRRGDRIVVGVLAADGRHILVFDHEGNLLFTQP